MSVTYRTEFGPGFVAEPMFEGMYFPAGEAHVKLTGKERKEVGELTQYARVNSADGNDLFELAMWADACLGRGEKTVLEIPYLPGARADHKEEMVFGARVYADFLNTFHVDRIICFDPHSMVMPSMLHNWVAIPSTRLVRQYVVGHADYGMQMQKYQGIIAPDKGAVDRASQVAKACHLPIYYAEKHRNKDTGKLTDFTCEPLPDEGKFLVVDDICDGGGTFMGLATVTGLPMERLGLYVSHGVFSGNAHNLMAYYHEVWTTDSLDTAAGFAQDCNDKSAIGQRVHVIPLANTLKGYDK